MTFAFGITGNHNSLFKVQDMIASSTAAVLTYEQTKEINAEPNLPWYMYCQIRHFMYPFLRALQTQPMRKFESLALQSLPQRGIISKIYKIINEPTFATGFKHSYMQKWETNLGLEITIDDWSHIW